MKTFTKIRQQLADNTQLRLNIVEIQNTLDKVIKQQDGNIKNIDLLFEYIDRLQEKADSPAPTDRKQIGYKVGKQEKK